MSKKVYILILNYNNWQDTIECLESVLKSDYENYQIIVVDNGSSDNSMDSIVNWAEGKQKIIYDKGTELAHLSQPFEPKPLSYILYTAKDTLNDNYKTKEGGLNDPIILIQSAENGGFAAGNNVGIKYALSKNDFEYIWLLNNDTVIQKDSVSKFVNSFEDKRKAEKLGVLGSIQYYYHNPDKIQASAGGFNKYTGNIWNYSTLNISQKNIAYIYGASMFIHKSVFHEIGLLSEMYFMYYEEIDFAERLRMKGYKMDVNKNISIYHKHGSTTSALGGDFRAYYLFMNKVKFYRVYYPRLLFVSVINILKTYCKAQIISVIKNERRIRFSTLVNALTGAFNEDIK